MEKRGVIEEGRTPPVEPVPVGEKRSSDDGLTDHPVTRLSDAAEQKTTDKK